MTQEQKELLLKDFCARLPYGVKVQHQRQDYLNEVQTIEKISRKYGEIETESVLGFVDDFKPYLFPLSSMTEEQRKEYERIIYKSIELHWHRYYDVVDVDDVDCLVDFYHKNHIDYRGLIPMGLAEDATSLNIY